MFAREPWEDSTAGEFTRYYFQDLWTSKCPKVPRGDFTAALGWKVTFLYNRWVEAGEMV